MSMFTRVIAALGMVALITACSREEAPPAPAYTDKPVIAQQETHYVFAVHPLQNPQLLHQKFQPLMQYLGEKIPGAEFDLDASSDYADYERKLRAGEHQFSLPNPYHAALARDWGYHIIAKMGDDELFRGVFIVRNDSPIKTPADLRGKIVSYPAPTALAAAMMPQLYLQKQGIDVQTELKNVYVGTHNSSIMNAYLGQSAAGATWPVAWRAFQKANPKEASELHVIWQTPTLIQNAIIARNDVPQPIVDQVQHLLVTLHESAAGRAILENIDTSSFVKADNAQFNVVTDFLKEYNARVKKTP
jgi:phosphonate transport system substrate-binding protein